MMAQPAGQRRTRWIIAVAIAAGAAVFIAANAHLVYVAVMSQPACVAAAGSPMPARTSC